MYLTVESISFKAKQIDGIMLHNEIHPHFLPEFRKHFCSAVTGAIALTFFIKACPLQDDKILGSSKMNAFACNNLSINLFPDDKF